MEAGGRQPPHMNVQPLLGVAGQCECTGVQVERLYSPLTRLCTVGTRYRPFPFFSGEILFFTEIFPSVCLLDIFHFPGIDPTLRTHCMELHTCKVTLVHIYIF